MRINVISILFFSVLFFSCFHRSSEKNDKGKIILIAVNGFTSSIPFQNVFEKNVHNLNNMFIQIADDNYIQLETKFFSQISLKNFMKEFGQFDISNKDVVVYFHFGKGSRFSNQNSNFPNLHFGDEFAEDLINFEKIHNDIKKLYNPKLLLSVADVSNRIYNNFITNDSLATTTNDEIAIAQRDVLSDVIYQRGENSIETVEYNISPTSYLKDPTFNHLVKDLFFKTRGDILITSAKPNSMSFATKSNGSYYTNNLVNRFRNFNNEHKTNSWSIILSSLDTIVVRGDNYKQEHYYKLNLK